MSARTPSLPEPFFCADEHIAIALPGARALFTTRRGGHSRGPYASLNLGRFTADDPAAVSANRAALQRAVGRRLVQGHQVHGSVVQVHRAGAGGAQSDALAQADGQATDDPALAPLVLTADCLPIAIAGKGAVAMVHAGWRGLAAGVISSGVRALRRLGASGELHAAIGPGAGACCYEVGEDVLRAFGEDGRAHLYRGRLDLKRIARERLAQAGVGRVHDVSLCTICNPQLFFSHRRDRGLTGRQAGIAWRC